MSATTPKKLKAMHAEKMIFLSLAIYFVIVTAAYAYVAKEPVGTVALGLSAVLFFIVTGYLTVAGKQSGPRLEDDLDAEIAQGAGELGFFAPKSIWPLWVALTIVVVCLGPVFGWWLTIAGIGMGIWSVSGWVFEFYVGDYAH